MEQTVRMVGALGVARDLRADHARGVVVVLRPAHAADRVLVEDLDLERAGRGAVVRTAGVADAFGAGEPDGLIHRTVTIASFRTPHRGHPGAGSSERPG